MTLTGHPTVDAIAQLHFQGNIVPHSWYRHIRYTNKRGEYTDPLACLILADVVFWYRPLEIRDETTGHITGYQKKFAEDKLQRNAEYFALLFGTTDRIARDSLKLLEELDLIDTELRAVRTNQGTIPTQMFIGLHAEQIAAITYPISAVTPEKSLLPKSVRRDYEMGKEELRNGEDSLPNSSPRLTELGETTIYREIDRSRDLERDLICESEDEILGGEGLSAETPFWLLPDPEVTPQESQEEPIQTPPAEVPVLVLTPEPEPKGKKKTSSPRISTEKGKQPKVVPASYVNEYFAQWWGKRKAGEKWIQEVNRDGFMFWCAEVGANTGPAEAAHVAWFRRWGEGDAPPEWYEQDKFYREAKTREFIQHGKAIGLPYASKYISEDVCFQVIKVEAHSPELFEQFFASYSENCRQREVDPGDAKRAIAAWNAEFKNPADAQELFSQILESMEYYFHTKDQMKTSDRATKEQRAIHPAAIFLSEKWRPALDYKRRKAVQTHTEMLTGLPAIPFGKDWDDGISPEKARHLINQHWKSLNLDLSQDRFKVWMEQAQVLAPTIGKPEFDWGNGKFGLSYFPDWVVRKLAWDIGNLAGGSKSQAA